MEEFLAPVLSFSQIRKNTPMPILHDLPIIILGASAGLLYGLLFISQKIRHFPNTNATPSQIWYHRISSILLSMLRIILLGVGTYYLLRSPTIPFILILVSFLAGFWCVIMKKKV
jgi:hypothetical protein